MKQWFVQCLAGDIGKKMMEQATKQKTRQTCFLGINKAAK